MFDNPLSRLGMRKLAAMTAAAALMLLIGVAFAVGQRDVEPTNSNVASQASAATQPPAVINAASQEVATAQASEVLATEAVETRDGISPGTSEAALVADSPQFVLPEAAAGFTPVGYGRVVGLTSDGSALYTVSAAPGNAMTCLQSRVLQFYLQPLDGKPRSSAGSHQIDGESVTAFASDGTHAVWVEFCEFAERVLVADVTLDGSLVNSRVVRSLSGDNRIGSVFQLSVENSIAQAFIAPDDPEVDANGRAIYSVERLDIDLEADRVLARSSLGLSADVDLPGPRVVNERPANVVVLPGGERIPFPGDNFGHHVAYDQATGTLYLSLYADTPGNAIILAHADQTTTFRAVGLSEGELVLATLEGGQSWLISQTSDCTSTLIKRSIDGEDTTVLQSDFPLTSLTFDTPTTWYARGWCGDSMVPAVQIGSVLRDSNGGIVGLQTELVTHIAVPNWNYRPSSRSGDSLVIGGLGDAEESLTITSNGELSTIGVTVGSRWFVRAYPLPAVFDFYDGWRVRPGGVEDAVMTFSHETGATVTFHQDAGSARSAMAGMQGRSVVDRIIPDERYSSPDTVTAQVTEYRYDDEGPVVSTLVHFSVDGTDVFVRASAPPESPEAQLAIEQLFRTLRYVEPADLEP